MRKRRNDAHPSTFNIAGYARAYATCRDLGHSWQFVRWHGLERIIVCEVCHSVRREAFTSARMDELEHRRYNYADGYLVKLGSDQAEVGIEVWRRISRLAMGQNLRVAADAKRVLEGVG